MWMSGYASRTAPAEGKETDLWAKAAVLRDGDGEQARPRHARPRRHRPRPVADGLQAHPGQAPRPARGGDPVGVAHPLRPGGRDQPAVRCTSSTTSRRSSSRSTPTGSPARSSKAVRRGGREPRAGDADVRRRHGRVRGQPPREQGGGRPRPARGGQLKGPIDHDVPVLAARAADGQARGRRLRLRLPRHGAVVPEVVRRLPRLRDDRAGEGPPRRGGAVLRRLRGRPEPAAAPDRRAGEGLRQATRRRGRRGAARSR